MARLSLGRLKSLLSRGKRLGKKISPLRRAKLSDIRLLRRRQRESRDWGNIMLNLPKRSIRKIRGKGFTFSEKLPNERIRKLAKAKSRKRKVIFGGLAGAIGAGALVRKYDRRRRVKK